MGWSRRQFLKNTSIATAGLIGGAGVLKKSAFAAYPAQTTSPISFVTGESTYGGTGGSTGRGSGGRWQMIHDVLAPFQTSIGSSLSQSTIKQIIIKPNFVYPGTTDSTGMPLPYTHWLAVDALVDFLRNTIGTTLPIYIAESTADSGTGVLSLMKSANYDNIATGGSSGYTGVTLVDSNISGTAPWGGSMWASNWIWKNNLTGIQKINVVSHYITPGSYLISICRPKTHNCMAMTATTKNCSLGMPIAGDSITGDVAGSTAAICSKVCMHTVGSSNANGAGEDKGLSYNIFQLATQYTLLGYPNFAILDAWEGMQGNGPISGTSVMQYSAAAGPDHIAVDRIAVKLMGFSDNEVLVNPNSPFAPPTHNYTDPRYLVWLGNAKIGNFNLADISFVNGTLAQVTAAALQYTLSPFYLGTSPAPSDTSYETRWWSADTLGPKTSIDSSAQFPPVTGVLDGGPAFITPQANMHANGIVTGNEVRIDLAMGSGYHVDIGIFNMKGQQIRRLASEYLNGGRYSIYWDCRSDNGSKAANGNYIIRAQFGHKQMCDKISLAR